MADVKKDYEEIQTEIHYKSIESVINFLSDKPIIVGSFFSEPTSRPFGSKFINGDIYTNLTNNKMYVYENGIWTETVLLESPNVLPGIPNKTFDKTNGYESNQVYSYNSNRFILLDNTVNNAQWAFYISDNPNSINLQPTSDIKYAYNYYKRVLYFYDEELSQWTKINPIDYVDNAARANIADRALIADELSGVDKNDIHTHTNKQILDSIGVNDEGKLTYNGQEVDTVIAQRDVYDGLDSHDNTISLSANMGRVLNESKAGKAEVTTALSNKLDKGSVYDSLDSNDSTLALSARQGKVLNETKANRDELHTHTNKQILDSLSEDDNGELLLNGNRVGTTIPASDNGVKLVTSDENNNISLSTISEQLNTIDKEPNEENDALILTIENGQLVWKKKSELEEDCSKYKFKIIANNEEQNVYLAINPQIKITVENSYSNTVNINSDTNSILEIEPNGEEIIPCSFGTYAELKDLAPFVVNGNNISWKVTVNDKRISITNNTGSDIIYSTDGNNWQTISSSDSVKASNTISMSLDSNHIIYDKTYEETPEPTPVAYSSIYVNSISQYKTTITASPTNDLLLKKGNDNVDVFYVRDSDDGATELVDDTLFTENVTISDGSFLTYTKPTPVAEPVAEHYSSFYINNISSNIYVTANDTEDVEITNRTQNQININNGSSHTLSQNESIVSTQYTTITP